MSSTSAEIENQLAELHLKYEELRQKNQAVEDKIAIREVLYRYARALDRLDEPLLASVFHDDAEVDYGPGLFQGPASELVPFAMQFQGAMQDTQHRVSNVLVKLEGNDANVESYVYAYHVMKQDEAMIDLVVGGRYLDTMQKRGDKWAISRRTEVIDWAHERPSSADWFDRQPPLNRGVHSTQDILYRF